MVAVRKDYHRHGIGIYLLEAARRVLASTKTPAYFVMTSRPAVEKMLKRLGAVSTGGSTLFLMRVET